MSIEGEITKEQKQVLAAGDQSVSLAAHDSATKKIVGYVPLNKLENGKYVLTAAGKKALGAKYVVVLTGNEARKEIVNRLWQSGITPTILGRASDVGYVAKEPETQTSQIGPENQPKPRRLNQGMSPTKFWSAIVSRKKDPLTLLNTKMTPQTMLCVDFLNVHTWKCTG